MTAIGPGQRSLYYIEHELRRMRRQRLRLLTMHLHPKPAGQYADEAVALMTEAIERDPIPEPPTDWSARALGYDERRNTP